MQHCILNIKTKYVYTYWTNTVLSAVWNPAHLIKYLPVSETQLKAGDICKNVVGQLAKLCIYKPNKVIFNGRSNF